MNFCFPTLDIIEYLQLLKDTISAPLTSLEQENQSFMIVSQLYISSLLSGCALPFCSTSNISCWWENRYTVTTKSTESGLFSSFELWNGSLQPAELGHMEMNMYRPQLLHPYQGKDGGMALKVNIFM